MAKLIKNDEVSSSISDLMSGLMILFLFVSIAFMVQANRKSQAIKAITENYKLIKNNLYEDLSEEFKGDLDKWKMEIEPDGTVRFTEPDVFFEIGKADLKYEFKSILDDFFPRYIKVISSKYKGNIEELRIEGHTSSEWNSSSKVSNLNSYFLNMDLSQARTRGVLQYVLMLPAIKEQQKWLMEKMVATGMSSSRLIMKNEREDKKASRRVEFKILTNAEKTIEAVMEENNNE